MTGIQKDTPANVVGLGGHMPRQQMSGAESSETGLSPANFDNFDVPIGPAGSYRRICEMRDTDMYLDDCHVAGDDGQRIKRQSRNHDAVR